MFYIVNNLLVGLNLVVVSSQIKCCLSHAPNTTGRPYREMLTYKPLTNNAVQEIELRKDLLNKLS